MPNQGTTSGQYLPPTQGPAWSYGLMGLGQQLAQAGAPSPYKQSPFAGLAQGAQGFGQGIQDYQGRVAQDQLLQLQQQEAEQRNKKLGLEAQKLEDERKANEARQNTLMGMAKTAPKNWTGDMQSWQNLVLTDPDSAAKWYEPKELKTLTETKGSQQRTVFYDAMTGETVKAGEYSPRWQGQQAQQPTEFSAWLEAFQRDNGRRPTAKEIADRDKRLADSIEYKNVIENGKVSTLPVGPQLDQAIQRGAVITGTTTQLTEAQSKAGMQFAIAQQANNRLDKVDQVLTSPGDYVAAQFGTIGNYAKTDEYRQAEQSARAMSEMFLRATTGAAATEPEIDRVKLTILPQPGDDPGTIAQKKQQRQMIVETLRLMSGSMAGQVEAIQDKGGEGGVTTIDGPDGTYTITPVQ